MLPKEVDQRASHGGAEARQRLLAVAANIPPTFGQFPDIEVALIAAQSGITAAIQIQPEGLIRTAMLPTTGPTDRLHKRPIGSPTSGMRQLDAALPTGCM